MTQKETQLLKNDQIGTNEYLYKKYMTNSNSALVMYLTTILIGILSLVFHDYFTTFKIVVLVSIFIPFSLCTVFFIKSYKARYVFYKRINRLDLVEYKIPPIFYLIIFIPFFIKQKHLMLREITILRQNTVD